MCFRSTFRDAVSLLKVNKVYPTKSPPDRSDAKSLRTNQPTMQSRTSRNLGTAGLHSSTFTKLRDSNNNSNIRSSFSSSPDIANLSTLSLGRRKNHPLLQVNGVLSNAFHHDEIDRVNLEMEGQLLRNIKSSSRDVYRNPKIQDPPIHHSTLQREDSSFRPSFSSFESSGASASSVFKRNTPINDENLETDTLRFITIGIRDLEQNAPLPNGSISQMKRSKSLAKFGKEAEFTLQNGRYFNSLSRKESQRFDGDFIRKPDYGKTVNAPWYKPEFSRECAVQYLISRPRGSFLVRKSTTHSDCFVLVMKVDEISQDSPSDRQSTVRHFLIDSTEDGLQFKGFSNEPKFKSLESLVEHYKKEQAVLPCALIEDFKGEFVMHYMTSVFTEVDNNMDAMLRAFGICFSNRKRVLCTLVRAQLLATGVAFNANGKLTHLRNFYNYNEISMCCVDPFVRKLNLPTNTQGTSTAMCGFLVETPSNEGSGCIHVFAMESMDDMIQFINLINKEKSLESLPNYSNNRLFQIEKREILQ